MSEWLLDPGQYERLLEGTLITIQILVYSFVLGVVLSLIFGVARLSEREWVRGAAFMYVEFARGISSIVLLFIIAIAVPILFDLPQASLIALASTALGLNMGGYGAEIVRGSIQAIPKGQTEACIALNLTPTQRLRYIILPQAMRIVLPPMGNLTIEILKGTALVSLVGVTDLLQSTRNVRQNQVARGAASTADLTILYANTLLIYFVMAQVIATAFRYFERRLESRYEARNEPLPADVATPNAVTG